MAENLGIVNVQNVPGDTDFDNNIIVADQIAHDARQASDKQTASANQTTASEPAAAPRAMTAAAWTRYERRIY